MIRPAPHLVIDARPRGPRGPLADERVLDRPILDYLLEMAWSLVDGPVRIHARLDEHDRLRSSIGESARSRIQLVTGPPPEHATILRSDRLYDPKRLRKAVLRGKDPESAVIWRLDRPQALEGADAELTRRRTYQPLGRYWALGPARALARWLTPTRIRPNALTIASAGLVVVASGLVAFGVSTWASQWLSALGLAMALVLDTSDGHLARLQGTASEFGRWLDANLDELGDMALHAAIAWSCFLRDGQPAWLGVGMLYAIGKYLYLVGASTGHAMETSTNEPNLPNLARPIGRLRSLALLIGHADIRWHLWIVLAAIGRLDVALVAYAVYFPVRAFAGAVRKAARHA